MCSIFSPAAQPRLGASRGKTVCGKPVVTASHSGVNMEPNKKDSSIFTGLSTQGILQTDQHVCEIVERMSQANNLSAEDGFSRLPTLNPMFLKEAYGRCRRICAQCAKNFYLGTLLMTKERQKAIWAIYAWCKRTDELVDGPNAFCMSPAVLDRWEERLLGIFDGCPSDILDAALADTVFKYHLDITPFRDMIEGMRMDTRKCRYENFQELYLYCYYVAGTVGLMSVPIMGIAPESSASAQSVYNGALYLGIGNQLTNILRDVGEDASRGRVYLPQDELAEFGLCDSDVFSRQVTDRWREFMKEQIRRARYFFHLAEEGASQLDKASRWPIWSFLLTYREILDAIEDNDYNNLTKRASVGRIKKLLILPLAYTKAQSTARLMIPH